MPFVVYTSSAGSGKTSTLVKEYLKLALQGPDQFRRILAVTFTNKAAEEMKTRILTSLGCIATRTNDDTSLRLIKDLQKETGLPEGRITVLAEQLLHNILHNYSDFSVSTIDSFVHHIVRAFARDLRLSWNFEVETEEEFVLSEAVDRLIALIGSDELLTRTLVGFAENQADDEKDWNIERSIKDLAGSLLNDESLPHLKKLKVLDLENFEQVRKQLFAFTSRFESRVREIAGKALKLIEDNGLSDEDFYQKGKGIIGYFQKMNSAFAIEDLFPKGHTLETIERDKWYTKQTIRSVQKKIDVIKPELTLHFHSLQKLIDTNRNDYTVSKLILKRIYALAVLNRIDHLLDQIKQKKNIVLISEFNKRVHEVVSAEPVPFIFERIGERYDHYLIDEFQDTSVLQWSNLLPLVDNSLASDHYNMVVGDGKQAIYRFRNGDVEQFDRLPEIYKSDEDAISAEREASLKRHFVEMNLEMNFRSGKNIVDFNNEFFHFLRQLPELKNKKIYENLHQESDPNHSGGYIKIDFIDRDDENEFNQHTLDRTIDRIKALKNEGFPWKAIAILTRDNKSGSRIAAHLMDREIPVVSTESVLIYRSDKVRFIVAVLQFLADSSNLLAKAEMIRYLHGKNGSDKTGLHEALKSVHESNLFFQTLESFGHKIYFKDLTFLSLYEIAETIISTFSLTQLPDLFVQHFLDVVLAYSVREGNSIDAFLSWWEETKSKYSVTVPEGMDAVKVMTIHKAKGLEFPVVILPKADWQIKPEKKEAWISPQLDFAPDLETALVGMQRELLFSNFNEIYTEEKDKSFLDNLNLLYVAMTRAKERLYIFCSEVKKIPNSLTSTNALFIRFLESKSVWNIQKKTYEFGEMTKNGLKEEKVFTYEPDSAFSTSWRKKLLIKQTTDWPQAGFSKKNWGNVVHAALAKVITPADIPIAVHAMEKKGFITAQQCSELKDNLTVLLNRDDIKPFFETGLTVKTEVEMISKTHGILRADRIILSGKTAIIVDYKTGRKHSERYKQQLNAYADAVGQMGYTRIEKFLLYTDENLLEKV